MGRTNRNGAIVGLSWDSITAAGGVTVAPAMTAVGVDSVSTVAEGVQEVINNIETIKPIMSLLGTAKRRRSNLLFSWGLLRFARNDIDFFME